MLVECKDIHPSMNLVFFHYEYSKLIMRAQHQMTELWGGLH